MITKVCSGDETKASALLSVRRFLRSISCSCRLLLLLTLLGLPVFAQTGAWARQRVTTLAWLHAVFFLDQNRGWAVGSRGTLLGTLDGGINWQAKSQPTGDILRDIYFTDDQTGWLVCETNIYELKTKDQPRTYLMQTSDGGEHWKRINIRGADLDARVVRAVFSHGRGWAFGEGGAIYATRDGGESWTRLHSPTRHLLLGGTFIDEDRGWLVGAGATIIQTSDGGETWHLSRLPGANETAIRFAATSFVDNRLGWVVGSSGSIYRTVNSRRPWQQQKDVRTTASFSVKC